MATPILAAIVVAPDTLLLLGDAVVTALSVSASPPEGEEGEEAEGEAPRDTPAAPADSDTAPASGDVWLPLRSVHMPPVPAAPAEEAAKVVSVIPFCIMPRQDGPCRRGKEIRRGRNRRRAEGV